MAGKVKPIPEGYRSMTPYLTMKGAARAIDFYKKVFGASEITRFPGPGGRLGHAEIMIGDSRLMMADEFAETEKQGPQSAARSPVSIYLYVDDVDATAKRAVDAGAKIVQPIEDKFYGDRVGCLVDPFGHTWFISTHKEDVAPDEMRRRAEAAMKHAGG